jgi:hypothetical protein
MNALSQISQITQLVVELGAGAEPHLQACIDALRNLKEPKLSPECGVCGDRFPIDDFEKHLCVVCCECDKNFPKDDLICVERQDKSLYCEECYEEKYIKCYCCDMDIDREEDKWVVAENKGSCGTRCEKSLETLDYCWDCFQDDYHGGKFADQPENVWWEYNPAGTSTYKEVEPFNRNRNCDICNDSCRKDDLIEWEENQYCADCFHEQYVRCELCGDPFDKEEGEWLSVSLEQPLRITKTCNGVIVRELCLECVQDNIEDFTPEFKTDEFAFIAEGCLRKEDIASILKDHAEMVAEMKWCERCDLCPQDYNNKGINLCPQDEYKRNEKNWCVECYFQHGAIDEEEEEEECKCGKPLYDMLLYYKEGTFCKCREEPERCENCDKNPIAPTVLCGFEKWCEVCDTALYSTKIDFVK